MSKIEQYKQELERIQELSILDTIDLVDRAHTTDKDTKVGRGDACWLYKSANQTLAIAARIEQLLTVKLTTTATNEEEEKQKEAEAQQLLAKVQKEYKKRKDKVKPDEEEAK